MNSIDRHWLLTPVEALTGIQIGADSATPPLPVVTGTTGRAALEQAVLPALLRPPCGVSFSGGRDSSMVLAIAAGVARKHGLPLPVPVSNVFPDDASSAEDDWQELVVRHLDLHDWQRFTWTDELDAVGPFAQEVLLRHGLVAPFNSHFHLPLFTAMSGGSCLTGIGGDELFAPVARWLASRVVYEHRRPRLRQFPRLLYAAAPASLRAGLGIVRPPFRFPWIRPRVHRKIVQAYLSWEAKEPLAWDASMRQWWWRHRGLQSNIAVKNAMGNAVNTTVLHPLCDAGFLAAYAGELGPLGPPSRSRAVETLVGDLLPPQLIRRDTKASFNASFWTDRGRAFARAWTGEGIDPMLVFPERVRDAWLAGPSPHSNSYGLLQQAWLTRHLTAPANASTEKTRCPEGGQDA